MATDEDHSLTLDTSPLTALDGFALLACQGYNHGNATDWFGAFRGGLYGFNARIHGVVTHNQLVHSWIPILRLPVETDYHVASILFNMDSAIECFAFMLNALGCAASQARQFRDVTVAGSLRKITPRDITDELMGGYGVVFPNLQAHWIASRDLISEIIEHHDVSKHREFTYSGGMARKDPPTGFYEALQAQDDPTMRALLSPSEEICLKAKPKQPRADHVSATYEERVVLERILSRFCTFINESCVFARDDAKNRIKLKYDHFQDT